MKRKYLLYAAFPLMGLGLLGAGTASAHDWFGFGANATPEQVAQRQTDMFTQQASLLGMSVDEVKNAWAQGKTLQELAAEKGIPEDQLKTKMQELAKQKMREQLQTLVSQGVITQAQADQRAAFLEKQVVSGRMGKMRHGFGMGM